MLVKRLFPVLLLAALGGCTADDSTALAADANSSYPAVAEQAAKVQRLELDIKAQEAVIANEKTKLDALQQQLAGSKQNLEGVKRQVKAE